MVLETEQGKSAFLAKRKTFTNLLFQLAMDFHLGRLIDRSRRFRCILYALRLPRYRQFLDR
jgi:hypothetical protein